MARQPAVARAHLVGSLVVGAIVCVACLALAGSAGAASIFYIQNNNVWVANPDGSGQTQLTSDGTSTYPYVSVAAAKEGSDPPVAFLHFTASYWQYGTIDPLSGVETINPDNANMPGNGQGDDHDISLDLAGNELAWVRATNTGVLTPQAVGVDGSNPLGDARGTDVVDTTFGDTGGQTLLFDDDIGYDYGHANNNARGWPDAPSACITGHSAYGLVRQSPVAGNGTLAAPIAYYCESTNTDLFEPALSPSGQTVAAEADPTPNSGANPSFTQGEPRIVTFALGANASGSTPTPLSFITPDGLEATHPDFSPDGSEITFSGANGIYVVAAGGGGSPALVIAGAASPAWSSYTLPAPAAPIAGPTPTPVPVIVLPAVQAISLKAHTIRSAKGFVVRINLSAAGSVVVEVERVTTSHRRKVLKLTGTVTENGRSGANAFTIKKVAGHTLAAGEYDVVVYTKAGAQQSAHHTLTLTVTR